MKTFKQFQESVLAIPAAAGIISRVLPAAAATIGGIGTIMQIKNRIGKGNKKKIKDRIGGQSPEVKQNHMTPRQRRAMEAQGLIPKTDLNNNPRKLPEEMMGAGSIVNNVGDGKIAGTVEAGDDPPVCKKKKRYVYGGRGSRKRWMV